MSRNQRRNRRSKSGASQAANRTSRTAQDRPTGAAPYRSSTETKSSLKTTELLAYAAAVLAVVITALAVDADGDGGTDPFGAESAIRYITYLTIGYLVARGLAKSGSYENRIDRDGDPADAAAPASVAHDPGTVLDDEDDEDGGTADGDIERVDTDVVPSDDVEHAGTANAGSRP